MPDQNEETETEVRPDDARAARELAAEQGLKERFPDMEPHEILFAIVQRQDALIAELKRHISIRGIE